MKTPASTTGLSTRCYKVGQKDTKSRKRSTGNCCSVANTHWQVTGRRGSANEAQQPIPGMRNIPEGLPVWHCTSALSACRTFDPPRYTHALLAHWPWINHVSDWINGELWLATGGHELTWEINSRFEQNQCALLFVRLLLSAAARLEERDKLRALNSTSVKYVRLLFFIFFVKVRASGGQ